MSNQRVDDSQGGFRHGELKSFTFVILRDGPGTTARPSGFTQSGCKYFGVIKTDNVFEFSLRERVEAFS
jgi:hypothetical protein